MTDSTHDPEEAERKVPAESFMQTLSANVDNERLSDAGFRELVRNTLPIVIFRRVAARPSNTYVNRPAPKGGPAPDGRTALLARLYKDAPAAVAKLCDEELDKSGALLGRVREAAAAGAVMSPAASAGC